MNLEHILALDNKEASMGELAHSFRAAQLTINELSNEVEKIQITGRLRHLDYRDHETIELLAIPVVTYNFVGEPNPTTPLHYKLHDLIRNWECPNPPNYRWIGACYKYSLTTVASASQLTIAQIIHTGPAEFVNWVTKGEAHRNGALPWGHAIYDYQLFNGSRKSLEILDEAEFFHIIGYKYIDLEDRTDGNPTYWKQFKLPSAQIN